MSGVIRPSSRSRGRSRMARKPRRTFLPGQRIRIGVTSSFLKYARNLNAPAVRISVEVVPASDPESPYVWPLV